MNEQELKDALAALTVKLEGKSASEIKTSIDAFEVKFNEAIASQVKTVREGLEADIKAVQEHADALDVKLKAQKSGAVEAEVMANPIKSLITENFDKIKTVRKGHSVELELKVVGVMTLGTNLTGDQPRIYRDGIVAVPSDAINFRDLISNVNIDGGTYTFPKETGSEGAIATQTEGADKSQIDYDITMVDVNTDFLAGYCRYSKKMANNLPFLESFLPQALRRDYLKAESAQFYTILAAAATASTTIVGNHIERIIENQMNLIALGYNPNIVVVNPADYGAILVTAGTDGTGAYSLPGVVTATTGGINLNGLAVIPAAWMPADLYIVGEFSNAIQVTTQGLGVNFFEQDQDNVIKNLITARVESQTALGVLRDDAFVAGDFTTIA